MKVLFDLSDTMRRRWPSEVNDFTPWLVEHLDQLSEAVGLDLDVLETEKERPSRAGLTTDYNQPDIVAVDRTSGDVVIIENQVEKLDDDHIAKALRYAAHLDAKHVVWVSARVKTKYQILLRWLQGHLGADVYLHAVVVKLEGKEKPPRLERIGGAPARRVP
jgi:hypothetical protein